MLITSGLVSLPAWANEWEAEKILSPALFRPAENEILAAVADTIIPAGDSIGALSVGTDKFLEKLFADCYDQAIQDNIKKQLRALDSISVTTYGKSFATADLTQRHELLIRFSEGDKDQSDFFALIKSETIRGFSTSKEVLGDRLKYKVVPGHYKGCVDINS